MKNQRRRLILEIIETEAVETQEELAEALARRGVAVTQATVSRDIKELGLIKLGNRYARSEGAAATPTTWRRLQRLLAEGVSRIDSSENLVVVKTLPGLANGVASAIDQARFPEIIGTVAGDDTIIIVVKPKEAVKGVIEKFRELIQ